MIFTRINLTRKTPEKTEWIVVLPGIFKPKKKTEDGDMYVNTFDNQGVTVVSLTRYENETEDTLRDAVLACKNIDEIVSLHKHIK